MFPHPSRRTRWLTRPPAPGTQARIFLIPYAGCGAGLFRAWPQQRGPVEFLPIELPGRETRLGEPIPATFEDLAAAMLEELSPYLDVPFAFFGHCWSALAAYEASVQLQLGGPAQPSHLFVSSQVAPQDGPVGRMLSMTSAQMSAELRESILAQGGRPHPELVSLYVDVLRADVEISRRYVVPDPVRLHAPVSAIGWTQDDEVEAARMTGWSACGEAEFTVLPGRHQRFIHAPPQLLDMLCAPFGPHPREAHHDRTD